MKQVNELKIFLASPSDVQVERTIVHEVLNELNVTYGTPNGLTLKLINWEDYSFPGIGEDPQNVINTQLPFDYDVFLCIFWTRIGTSTNRSKSGTIEELEIALDKKKNGENIEIMGYFKTEPPSSLNDISEQFFDVQKLKSEFGKNCLYKEFTSTHKFKDIFRINFTNFLNNKFSNKPKLTNNSIRQKSKVIKIGNDKRDIIKKKLESLNIDKIIDTEFYDTMDLINKKTNEITTVLEDITINMNEMSEKVSEKTKEITDVGRITDNRLRLKKGKIVVNQLANELEVISDKYEVYIPEFKNHYLELVNFFIKIYSNYDKYMTDNDKKVKGSLLLSIDSSIESLTDLLVEMNKVPKITSKFGQAQIRQMKLLKILVEEILYGRELLDQIE